MTPTLLILTLGAALTVSACTTSAADTSVTADPGITLVDAAAKPATPAAAAALYRNVTLPAGTTLPMSLTSAMASDRSVVEDVVTAELTRAVGIDGREVLPAGTTLAGHVTDVADSRRVKGRAMIAFRFTSLRTGGERYNVQTKALTHLAPATKRGDATAKIGIGAGAGMATKGKELRLAPGANVTSQLIAPLSVRLPIR